MEMTREDVRQAIYDYTIQNEEIKEKAYEITLISLLKLFGCKQIPERLAGIVSLLLYQNMMIYTMENYREKVYKFYCKEKNDAKNRFQSY